MSSQSPQRRSPPPARRRLPSTVTTLALIGLACAGRLLAAAPSGTAAFIGNWWGRVEAPHETVDLGFELRTNAEGAVEATLTQPGASYFGMALPGKVEIDGNHVVLAGLLEATLDGDRLVGTFASKVPIELRRVEALPTLPPVPDLPTGPPPRWQTRLNGQVFSSPVVAEGIAFVGTTGGVFQAIRVADGSFAWTFAPGKPILGTARLDGDAVYFTCDDGYLYKLQRSDGKQLWRYDLGDARVPRVLGHPAVFEWDWQGTRPLVDRGTVYVGSGDGSFHAVDAASGARRWRVEAGGKIRGGAAPAGDRVLVGGSDHFIYAFDRASGRQLWRHDTGADVENELLVVGDEVIAGNRGTGLIALAVASGEELWHTTFWGSWLESTPALVDGVLYVGSSDLERVSALDPRDGRVLWRTDVYGWTFGTPLVTDRFIYAGAAGGTPYFMRHVAGLLRLDRKTGKLLARWPLADAGGHQWGIASSLALSGDTIVATTVEGSIFGFPVG